MSSLLRMVEVMTNKAGSDDDVDGCDVAEMWMSVSAATVLATTCRMGGLRRPSPVQDPTNAYHWIAV